MTDATEHRVANWIAQLWLRWRGVTTDENGVYFAKYGLRAGTQVRTPINRQSRNTSLRVLRVQWRSKFPARKPFQNRKEDR